MSARQDYPPIPTGANVPGGWGLLHLRMCEEIDRLRLSLAWWERIARDRGEENETLRARGGHVARNGCPGCVVDGQHTVELPTMCCVRCGRTYYDHVTP